MLFKVDVLSDVQVAVTVTVMVTGVVVKLPCGSIVSVIGSVKLIVAVAIVLLHSVVVTVKNGSLQFLV